VRKLRVKLLPYGLASIQYAEEAKKAVPCEARVTDACAQSARGLFTDLGDRCGYLAKIEIDGKRLCIKHASMVSLSRALKAGSI
jgi:hypothetical protein